MLTARYFAYCGPRGALNLHSLIEHGTIELRLLEGTLDVTKAEAWIRFGQRFINEVLKRKTPLPPLSDAETVLRKVRAGKQVRKLLAQDRDITHHSFRGY